MGLLVYPVIQLAEPKGVAPAEAWAPFVRVNLALTLLECLCACFPAYLTYQRLRSSPSALSDSAVLKSPLLAEQPDR